jgi:hypothetical protein
MMSNPHAVVLDSIAQSNLPIEKKSHIRAWFDKMTGGALSSTLSPTLGYVREGGQIIRQGGESAIVGGLLAFIKHKRGSLDVDGYPIDGAMAAAGYAAAMAMANDPYGVAVDARNAAAAATAVYTYRKGEEWLDKNLAKKDGPSGAKVHGEDPIAAAARDL